MILTLLYCRPLFPIVQIESSLKDKALQQLRGEKIRSELGDQSYPAYSKNAFAKDLLTDAFNRSNRPNSFRVVFGKVKPHHLVEQRPIHVKRLGDLAPLGCSWRCSRNM